MFAPTNNQPPRMWLSDSYLFIRGTTMNTCINCNKETTNPRFCSKSCAAKYNNRGRVRTEESKLKTATQVKKTQTLLGLKSSPPVFCKVRMQTCAHCNKVYWRIRKKFCSVECGISSRTKNALRKTNRQKINGFWLDSGYEVEIATWLNENRIEWIRPKYITYLNECGKETKYFPDFYLPQYDVYLDPKNEYLISISTHKITQIRNKVELLVGTPLEIVAALEGLEPPTLGSEDRCSIL